MGGAHMLKSIDRVATGVYRLRPSEPLSASRLGIDARLDPSWLKGAEVAGAGDIPGRLGVDRRVRSAAVLDGPLAEAACRALRAECERVCGDFLASQLGFSSRTYDGDQIVLYGVGDHFGEHRDRGRNFPHRCLSIVRCLEMNCVGGELAFPDCHVQVRSEPGDYVIFAPDLLHASRPVRSGRKLVYVTWLVF